MSYTTAGKTDDLKPRTLFVLLAGKGANPVAERPRLHRMMSPPNRILTSFFIQLSGP